MDITTMIVVWIVILGVVVALVAWFGPRPSQWRTHTGEIGESGDDQQEQEKSSGSDVEPVERRE